MNLRTRKQKFLLKPERLGEILFILAQYGFRDWIRGIRLHRRIPRISRAREQHLRDLGRWHNLRRAFEELGPSFMKLGQILSTRSDILPKELIHELQKLQHSADPLDWEELEPLVRKELGGPLEGFFLHVDPQPIASASIAQVHRAVGLNGTTYALKIQRPGIRTIIEEDLGILQFLAGLADRYMKEARIFDLQGIVQEFGKHIQKELSFTQELQNIRRFQQIMGSNKKIVIPGVVDRLCTDTLLVMEFIQGTSVSEILTTKNRNAWNTREIGRIGAEAILDMVLIHGFFHADPHPGNLFVLSDGSLCLLDFGMTGNLSSREQRYIIEMLLGMLDRDVERVTRALLAIIPHPDGTITPELLSQDLEELINQYLDLPLKYINIGLFIQQTLQIIRSHQLAIPSKFLFMGKAITTVEGVGRQLYPDFNLLSLMGPITKKIAEKQLNPKNLQKKA